LAAATVASELADRLAKLQMLDEALTDYKIALVALEKLAKEEPQKTEHQRDLAGVHSKVGGANVDSSLQVRVGIAIGVVVVSGLMGTGAPRELAVIGETPESSQCSIMIRVSRKQVPAISS
jgi:hypothetical protein